MEILVILTATLPAIMIAGWIACELVDYLAKPKCKNHYDCINCVYLKDETNWSMMRVVGFKFRFYCSLHARRSEKKIRKIVGK